MIDATYRKSRQGVNWKTGKKKKVVKDTAALKTNLTFREGLFPFRKKEKSETCHLQEI